VKNRQNRKLMWLTVTDLRAEV